VSAVLKSDYSGLRVNVKAKIICHGHFVLRVEPQKYSRLNLPEDTFAHLIIKRRDAYRF
jgi:hypothetical protein